MRPSASDDLPSISIVVPTHGRRRQLARCLSALAELDFPRDGFEVIVVDDGSPEPVDEVVAPLREKIELRLLRGDHLGPASARNLGAREARGTVLAFTDDDCIPEPRWLRALAAGLNGGKTAVGGRMVSATPEGLCSTVSQAIVDWAYAHYNEGPQGPRFFASNNLAVPCAAFLELGGFDASFRTAEDRELCDRWRHHGLPLAYAQDARVVHASELSVSEFVRRHFRYGRGAHRFDAVRRSRRSGSLARDLRFYVELPRRMAKLIAGEGLLRAAKIAGLLILWQLANTAGFSWEAAVTARDPAASRP